METEYQETDLRDLTSSNSTQESNKNAVMDNTEADDSHNTTDDALETILQVEEDAMKNEAPATNLSKQPISQSVGNINPTVVNALNTSIVRSANGQNVFHTQTRGLQTIVTPISVNVPSVIRTVPVAPNPQNPGAFNFVTVNTQNPTNVPTAPVQTTFNPMGLNKVVFKGQPVQFLTQDVVNPGLKTAVIAKKPVSAISFKPGEPAAVPVVNKPHASFQNNITLSPVKGGFKIPISPLKNFKNPVKLSLLPSSNANSVRIDANLSNNQSTVLNAGPSNFQFQTLVTPQANRLTVSHAPQQSIPQSMALQPNVQGGKVQCLRLVPSATSQQTQPAIPITNVIQSQPGPSTLPVKATLVQPQQQPPSIQPYVQSPSLHKTISQPPAKTQRLIMPARDTSTGPHNNPPTAVTNLSPGSVLQAGNVGYAMVPAKYVEELKKQLNNQLLQANKLERAAASATPEPLNTHPIKLSINGKIRKPCNCTKSMCLKLYCECFANGHFCNDCNCINCHNNVEFDADRSKAIKSCLDRNPSAFKPKIGRGCDDNRTHQKGCNCKRSGCLKNYCECYEARIPCTSKCKCIGCKNIEEDGNVNSEQPSLMNLADAAAVRCQQQAAARSRINSQMKDMRSNRLKSQANLNAGDRLPCMFFTQDVIEATCTCLLAQAEEAEKTNRSNSVAETMILEEFGRCLMQIIQAAAKAKPTAQS